MHRPPAVTHSVDRSRWHIGLVASLAVVGVVACAGLTTTLPSSAERLASGLATLCAITLAFWNWKNTALSRLQWDGQYWRWSGFGDLAVHEIRLILDFQHALLVRVYCEDGKNTWLWLETRSGDRHWLSLRRAILASRRRAAGPDEPDDLYGGDTSVGTVL